MCFLTFIILPYTYTCFLTDDGSHSLKLNGCEESFHSHYGAINESNCVFIDAGLKPLLKEQMPINILEVGFGTGLNALLTLVQVKDLKNTIYYHGIEPFPIEPDIIKKLNYPDLLGIKKDIFYLLHQRKNAGTAKILNNFILYLDTQKIQDIALKDDFYNLVYFDAFNPVLEPEMWEADIFKKLFKAMKSSGLLCTYSSKGSVRRHMKEARFTVEKLAGPKGKREICRAKKP